MNEIKNDSVIVTSGPVIGLDGRNKGTLAGGAEVEIKNISASSEEITIIVDGTEKTYSIKKVKNN